MFSCCLSPIQSLIQQSAFLKIEPSKLQCTQEPFLQRRISSLSRPIAARFAAFRHWPEVSIETTRCCSIQINLRNGILRPKASITCDCLMLVWPFFVSEARQASTFCTTFSHMISRLSPVTSGHTAHKGQPTAYFVDGLLLHETPTKVYSGIWSMFHGCWVVGSLN